MYPDTSIEQKLHQFTVNKSKIMLQAILPDSVHLNESIEAELEATTRALAIRLSAYVGQGETTTDEVTYNRTATTHTFASLWDHIKFSIRSIKLVPKWLKDRIYVRYTPQQHEFSFTLPVTVNRTCPHVDFGNDPRKHIYFLYPEEWKKQELPTPPPTPHPWATTMCLPCGIGVPYCNGGCPRLLNRYLQGRLY